MTKKLLLPLGALLIASPLALTISCSKDNQQNAVDYVISHINPSEDSLNKKTAAELSMILEEGTFNEAVISAMGIDVKLPGDLKGVTLKYEIDMPKYNVVKVGDVDAIDCLFDVKIYAIKKDHITKMRGFTLTAWDRALLSDEKIFNNLIVERIANHYTQENNFGEANGEISSSLSSFELIKTVTFHEYVSVDHDNDPLTASIDVWPTTNVRLTMEVIDMLGLSDKWMPKKIESTSVWYSLSKETTDTLKFGIHIVRPNATVINLNYIIVKGE